MADPKSAAIIDGLNASRGTLRETAKWLVGGVTATAVGVFAGSSLTQLGSLGPANHPARLLLAILGLALGFAGLGFILHRAIKVLTVEGFSFRELVAGEMPKAAATAAEAEALRQRAALIGPARDKYALLKIIRPYLEEAHRGAMPRQAAGFADLLAKWTAARARRRKTASDTAFIENCTAYFAIVTAEAGFLYVKARFRKLVKALWLGGSLATVGFGLFAWAANPPEPKNPPSRPPLLVINHP